MIVIHFVAIVYILDKKKKKENTNLWVSVVLERKIAQRFRSRFNPPDLVIGSQFCVTIK
jgi:hypothetical protein